MGSAVSSQQSAPTGDYVIYDYRQVDPRKTYPNANDWKKEIATLTKERTIVSWSHYTTPLKMLGPFGELGRWMSRQRGVDDYHGLFHKYIVFQLVPKDAEVESSAEGGSSPAAPASHQTSDLPPSHSGPERRRIET